MALLIGAWLAVHFMAAGILEDSVFDGGLLGTDSYMRVVRVDELASGGGWFDSTIERSNAPFGDELHWTRPFDVLILAIAAPLGLAIGFDDALFVSGAVISPLLHLAMLFALVWAVTPLVGRGRAPMAAIVLVVQPAVLAHTVARQADHHSLQLLLLVVEIGLLVRALADPRRIGTAVAAGVVAGLGIWVSAEMTILAGLAAAALVAAWIQQPDTRARTLAAFGAGMTALIALAIVTERVPSDWLAVEYDKVSVPHLAAGAAVLLVAAILEVGRSHALTWRGRAAVAAFAGIVAGAPLLGGFGGLLGGPAAGVNPALGPIWLDHVRELKPLWPSDVETLGRMLLLVGPAFVCLPVAAAVAWRKRHEDALPWATIAVLLTAYLALSLVYLRFASFAGVLIAVVSAEALGLLRDWLRTMPASVWRRAAWVGATLGLSVGFTFGGGVVSAAGSADTEASSALGCSRAAYDALDAIVESGDVVFAHLDLGPEILYRTDASVVAGPYHRNDRGILDLHEFFSSTDPEVSREVAAERGGRFVLYCQIGAEEALYASGDGSPSLYDRLVTATPPSWLHLIAGEDGIARYAVYGIESR
ncbi:MAG: hypothetical protein O3A10_10665 [Chloroflexi bacterium]|nr:hypothetical protein [Chloroflexota bacterium]MDA1145875.1 hypothetical protein [Chloroflexota bacterium]